MGIFTRFRDIVSSNINAMLDKAEDPEKLIRLMIREMEDTLVDLKAACAGVLANRKRVERTLEDLKTRVSYWGRNAELAVSKGRDDLAREALLEKRKVAERLEGLDQELSELVRLVDQYHEDIGELEQRLQAAREKQRTLVQRHIHATRKRRAQEEIRRADGAEAVFRFEQLENRIDHMEADADMVNFKGQVGLAGEFDNLAVDEEIEKELQGLKASLEKRGAEERPAV
jgi:phage shock protein A